jgi:chromosome segregation ATPase
MTRIESSHPATSSRVNGIAFAPHPNPERTTKVSALVEDDLADRLCQLPGYERCGALTADEETALGDALAKLAMVEELGPRGTAVSQAERTVQELQGSLRTVHEERDRWRDKAQALEQIASPDAAARLQGEVQRLTGEVAAKGADAERLAGELAAKDAQISDLTKQLAEAQRLNAELAKASNKADAKDDKNKASK